MDIGRRGPEEVCCASHGSARAWSGSAARFPCAGVPRLRPLAVEWATGPCASPAPARSATEALPSPGTWPGPGYGSADTDAPTVQSAVSVAESRWMPWRSHRLRVLPPGFRVPWVHPSLPHPARGLSDPGPCAECSPLIRVIRVVLWSLRVPPPTPLRARPATGHLIALTSPGLHASALSLRTGCRRPIPAGRGPSRCVRAGTSFRHP